MDNKFYMFNQNNSGGHFVSNTKLCHRVVIEADSQQSAENKAFDLGIYYDGVEDGRDCPCCGDRWYSPDCIEFPYKFSTNTVFDNIVDYCQRLADDYGWTSPDARIFYLDGTITEVFCKSNRLTK